MKYTGKLYGKISGRTFDTGKTTDDWNAMVESLAECHEHLRNLNDPNGYEPVGMEEKIKKAEKALQRAGVKV